jgi:hypothetical protein
VRLTSKINRLKISMGLARADVGFPNRYNDPSSAWRSSVEASPGVELVEAQGCAEGGFQNTGHTLLQAAMLSRETIHTPIVPFVVSKGGKFSLEASHHTARSIVPEKAQMMIALLRFVDGKAEVLSTREAVRYLLLVLGVAGVVRKLIRKGWPARDETLEPTRNLCVGSVCLLSSPCRRGL